MTESTARPARPNAWKVSLLGGFRRAVAGTAPQTMTVVSTIGGLNLDLHEATLPPGGSTLTKVSLVGGCDIRVPAGVRVVIQKVTLLGHTIRDVPEPGPDAPVLTVRCYGLIGGVHVHI